MKKVILFIIMILLLPLFPSQEVTASNFSATFELDFFNKDPNVFTTETFRRYHQLDLNYQFWENFFIKFIYNWCDNVTSSISAHEITPWQIMIVKDQYEFNTVLVSDIINNKRSYTYNFSHNNIFRINDKYQFHLKLGIKANQNGITPDYGGAIRRDNLWLGINYLSPIDAKLMDETDGRTNLPLTISYEWQPREDNYIRFEYNHHLLKSETEKNYWAKIALVFRLY